MAEHPKARVTPRVLRWAREAAGLSIEAAAKKVAVAPDVLERAEAGDHFLTLRQAQTLGKAYGRSLAFLMRSQPPDEASADSKFRRLRGAPPPPWSPDFIRLEREIHERQNATVDIYDVLDEDPPWPRLVDELEVATGVPSPDVVRTVLGLDDPSERRGDQWTSRRVVLRAVEWAGVLVVRQRVPDNGVRGFLSPHDVVPAIYVNSGEDPRAQAFTILHEFAHLLLAVAGEERADEEGWCERYAATVLMETGPFRDAFAGYPSRDPITKAIGLGQVFGVTPYAAAVRAWQLDLFTGAQLAAVRDRPKMEAPEQSSGDGNRTKVARLSPTFTDLVLTAAESSAVTLSTASRLLRTKVDDFDKLRTFAAQALAD